LCTLAHLIQRVRVPQQRAGLRRCGLSQRLCAREISIGGVAIQGVVAERDNVSRRGTPVRLLLMADPVALIFEPTELLATPNCKLAMMVDRSTVK
jgi:hypothetical protein